MNIPDLNLFNYLRDSGGNQKNGIAVIDSGVHVVDDLKDALGHNRIAYNYDSLGGGADDQYGHGTHVAGIIGGSGKDFSLLQL